MQSGGAPHEGLPANADGIGESGSLVSGPGVRLAIVIGPEGRIETAGYELVDFDVAGSCAETVCELLEGATVAEAGRITAGAVATLTGADAADPAVRTVHFALRGALQPLLRPRPPADADIVCTCFEISRQQLIETIERLGLRTVDEVRDHLPATHGCGTCRPDIAELLDDPDSPSS